MYALKPKCSLCPLQNGASLPPE
ncbi:hypothetical protein ACNKHV_18450 [Shigella flexneri]